ncbi:MAG: choline/carnitine O-acyltransferase [Fastidiosipilaceae bacterium]|jgi:carnitine O-acetyltransferase
MSLFTDDAFLPKYPVPDLDEVVEDLKQRARPIVSEQSFKEFCDALDEFIATDGTILYGEVNGLARGLPDNDSWLRPIWDDNYLRSRLPLPQHYNYTLQLNHRRWGPYELVKLIRALTSIILRIRAETLPRQKGKVDLSMDTLNRMIYTRVPAPERDVLYLQPLTGRLNAAVVCRGHWFIMALRTSDGALTSTEDLMLELDSIRAQAGEAGEAVCVSAYTAADRDEALRLRGRLCRYRLNRLNLADIEQAMFVICLDPEVRDEEAFGLNLIAGDAGNRFYDKSLQVISSGDHLGLQLEHSGCDGGMWDYIIGQCDKIIGNRKTAPTSDTTSSGPSCPCPRRLKWMVDDDLKEELERVEQEQKIWRDELDICQHRLPNVSGPIIKKLNCSPDAYVQLLFQSAHYRLEGRFDSIYEAVSTRHYHQGRTEDIRTVTPESVSLLRALERGEPVQVIRRLLSEASRAHRAALERAMKASGAGRFFTALRAVHEMYRPNTPEPAIFSHKVYQMLSGAALTTSGLPGEAIAHFAFPPVQEDGFGVGYGLNEGGTHVAVTGYKRFDKDPKKLVSLIIDSNMRLMDALTGS